MLKTQNPFSKSKGFIFNVENPFHTYPQLYMSTSVLDLLKRVEQYPEIFQTIVQQIQKKNQKVISIGVPMSIRNSLYHKYNQSEQFYNIRAFNDIFNNASTPVSINFRDLIILDNPEEFLKRQYKITEYQHKLTQLIDYYKFHNDIPRIFIIPASNTLNRYYDKKRKLQYFKILKLIEEENKKNPGQPPKGIVGDIPSNSSDFTDTQTDSSCTMMEKQRRIQWLKSNKLLTEITGIGKKDVSNTLKEIVENIHYQANCKELEVELNSRKHKEWSLKQLISFISFQNQKQIPNPVNTKTMKIATLQTLPESDYGHIKTKTSTSRNDFMIKQEMDQKDSNYIQKIKMIKNKLLNNKPNLPLQMDGLKDFQIQKIITPSSQRGQNIPHQPSCHLSPKPQSPSNRIPNKNQIQKKIAMKLDIQQFESSSTKRSYQCLSSRNANQQSFNFIQNKVKNYLQSKKLSTHFSPREDSAKQDQVKQKSKPSFLQLQTAKLQLNLANVTPKQALKSGPKTERAGGAASKASQMSLINNIGTINIFQANQGCHTHTVSNPYLQKKNSFSSAVKTKKNN